MPVRCPRRSTYKFVTVHQQLGIVAGRKTHPGELLHGQRVAERRIHDQPSICQVDQILLMRRRGVSEILSACKDIALKLAAAKNPVRRHTHVRHGVEREYPRYRALRGADLHNRSHRSQGASAVGEDHEPRQKHFPASAQATHDSFCYRMTIEVPRQGLAGFFEHRIILFAAEKIHEMECSSVRVGRHFLDRRRNKMFRRCPQL